MRADDWDGLKKVKANSVLPIMAVESCIVIRKQFRRFEESKYSNLGIYEFERFIARKSNAEASVCLSPGYLAGQIVASYFGKFVFIRVAGG